MFVCYIGRGAISPFTHQVKVFYRDKRKEEPRKHDRNQKHTKAEKERLAGKLFWGTTSIRGGERERERITGGGLEKKAEEIRVSSLY